MGRPVNVESISREPPRSFFNQAQSSEGNRRDGKEREGRGGERRGGKEGEGGRGGFGLRLWMASALVEACVSQDSCKVVVRLPALLSQFCLEPVQS